MIIVFTYFYTAVQFNPVDQADNLRKYGGYIPGIRPGPPTAQYLDRVLTRLTLPGSLFLATVAVLPSIFIKYGGFSQANSRALGGTSVLIAVGVALDTMRQMETPDDDAQLRRLPQVEPMTAGSMAHARAFLGVRAREPSSLRSPGVRQGHPGEADLRDARNPARLHRRHVPCGHRWTKPSSGCASSRSSTAATSSPTSSPSRSFASALRSPTRRQASCSTASLATCTRPRRSTRCWRRSAAASTRSSSSTSTTRPRRRACSHERTTKAARTTRPKVIARRLALYHEETEPVVERYRAAGKLVPLHADRSVDEVYGEIDAALRLIDGEGAA